MLIHQTFVFEDSGWPREKH